MDRGTEFSRARRLSASVGLRREGSKSAITSHKNCRRAGVEGKSSWLFRTFQLSADQLIVLTLLALSALAQVRCVGRTRNVRGSRMTDASFLVPIRRIQVIVVAIQLAREAVRTPICSNLLHKRGLSLAAETEDPRK